MVSEKKTHNWKPRDWVVMLALSSNEDFAELCKGLQDSFQFYLFVPH